MNKLDKTYTDLLQDILDNGVSKSDRTGTGTISIFGRQIRHKMSDGFPLLTTKKMPFKTIVTELLWFLKGDTNIKYLVDNGCNVWNGDALKAYHKHELEEINRFRKKDPFTLVDFQYTTMEEFINKIKTDDEFAKKWGELGPIYGKQWRNWNTRRVDLSNEVEDRRKGNPVKIKYIDQIANLINELKTNPDSRRLMVNAWNVGELDQMVLPPCHYGFQVYTRELSHQERCILFGHNDSIDRTYSYSKWLDDNGYPKRAISLMWNQRSVDTFLGLPFNIASYGLLLEIIAKVVNMVPDELIGNLGDTHLYSNHIEQAKEQIGRELTFEEKIQWVMNNTDVAFEEDLYITEAAASLSKRTREPFELPTLNINTEFWPTEGGECGGGPISVEGFIKGLNNDNFIGCLLEEDIQLGNYKSHPSIKAPLSN